MIRQTIIAGKHKGANDGNEWHADGKRERER